MRIRQLKMFSKKSSIRKKLINIIILSCAFVIVFGISIITIGYIRYIKQDIINRTIMETKLIGEYCVTPLSFDYPERAKEVLEKLRFWPDIIAGIVFDNKGKIFAEYKIDGANTKILIDRNNKNIGTYHLFEDDKLHVCSNIFYKNMQYGSIYIILNTKITEKIDKFLVLISLLMFFLLILAYLVANNMQKFISKPILKLTNIAEEIYKKT
ncbi:MAG: hypothetical protein HQK78_07875, partial [Desulfobacterales bacterium]|nr:hypothetical protein [Desulfobacterales bacterium]